MIRLRLQRKGRKKRPYYHIVVADKRSPRDGRIIERVGRFDNISENKQLLLDEERIIHWLRVGAQPSDTVRNLLKGEGILYKMHLIRWGKSEEEIEAALAEWREQRETTSEKKVSRKEQQKSLLEAEEKEYKKQLEQKAAEAAKEVKKAKEEAEKKEAEAQAAEEVEETASADKETETVEAEPETQAEAAETGEDQKDEEPAETKADAADSEAEVKEDLEEEAEAEEEKKAEAKTEAPPAEEKDEEDESEADGKAETKADEEEKEETESAALDQKSTDMNANEAIDFIKDTPLEKLKGFVPDDEERVTVLRAWESKQSE